MRIVLVSALGVALAACGGGAAKAPAPVDLSSNYLARCEERRAEVNRLRATCFKENPAYLSAPGPGTQFDTCAEEAKSVAARRIAYDDTKEAACIASLRALDCAGFFALSEESTRSTGSPKAGELPACQGLLTGQLDFVRGCHLSAECRTGYCTADWLSTCPGFCEPLLQEGAFCAVGTCAAGLICGFRVGSTVPFCFQPGASGEICPCGKDFWCDASGGVPGVCRPRISGGACDPATNPCAKGTGCLGGECRPIVGAGESCSGDPGQCGLGYLCASGTCVSCPRTGEPCGPSGCIGGWCDAYASNPTCIAFLPLGSSCYADFLCASGSCAIAQSGTAGTCAVAFCTAP